MISQILSKAFFDKFFPRNMREVKVVESINLHQGGMSVHDYSLKFIQLSKYVPSLVSNPTGEMSLFVTSVFNDIQKEFNLVMLHDNINISHLMVHHRMEERARSKRKDGGKHMARSFEGGSRRNSLEIQDNPRFKKRFSNHVPSKVSYVLG